MKNIIWLRQSQALNGLVNRCVRDKLEPHDTKFGGSRIVMTSIWDYGSKSAGVIDTAVNLYHLLDMINHIKELPKLKDGVQLNDNLWVRVVFVDWDLGTVSKYTLFANGLSPHQELLNEAIGSEQCEGKQLNELPECIATPLLMRRVRGKDTATIHMPNSRTVWMNDLQVTVEDVNEITRRDKWEYQPQGKSICKELTNLLHQQGRTRGSA